jgi:2'-5' RNA ligase
MPYMRRLLIMGIFSEEFVGLVRRNQEMLSNLTANRLALKFPVHVTLRGPFWTNAEDRSLWCILEEVCRSFRRFRATFNGPVFVEPDLCWLEADAASTESSSLLRLHRHFEQRLKPCIVIDDVPEEFKDRKYRPHVTLGWGTDVHVCQNMLSRFKLPDMPSVVERVAIGGYPKTWPMEGAVKVLESIELE